jgi:hypothetical protein
MPRLPKWPGSQRKSRGKQAPSTWSRMTSGTKSVIAKTTDALNPWDDGQPAPRSVTGSNSVFSPASTSKKESEKKSFLPSWNWGAEEEEKRPKTVNDFLALPKPEF